LTEYVKEKVMIDLDSLIESVDIAEYIEQFTDLELKGHELWGLSPLKEENTPSFSVDQEKQCFYDFSSGKAGGIITFIMEYYKCSKAKAISILREYVGENGIVISPHKMDIAKVYKKYRTQTKTDSLRRDNQQKVKVMPERIMDKYIWDEEKLKVWFDEGISYEVMMDFGVRYDPITDRIVYPIRNIHGEIVNVGARTLDPNYKEKGLRKYSYLQGWNGGMDVIYGLHDNLEHVKETGYLILFEGAKSVLKAASMGIWNTGAILTSHLNPNQIRILLSTCCLNNVAIIFALDKDVNVADDNNIKKLLKYLNVYYLQDTENLLEDKDSPIDRGFEVFKTLCINRKKLR
jgi:DNA primase